MPIKAYFTFTENFVFSTDYCLFKSLIPNIHITAITITRDPINTKIKPRCSELVALLTCIMPVVAIIIENVITIFDYRGFMNISNFT